MSKKKKRGSPIAFSKAMLGIEPAGIPIDPARHKACLAAAREKTHLFAKPDCKTCSGKGWHKRFIPARCSPNGRDAIHVSFCTCLTKSKDPQAIALCKAIQACARNANTPFYFEIKDESKTQS